jgi:hypothetical protein
VTSKIGPERAADLSGAASVGIGVEVGVGIGVPAHAVVRRTRNMRPVRICRLTVRSIGEILFVVLWEVMSERSATA